MVLLCLFFFWGGGAGFQEAQPTGVIVMCCTVLFLCCFPAFPAGKAGEMSVQWQWERAGRGVKCFCLMGAPVSGQHLSHHGANEGRLVQAV